MFDMKKNRISHTLLAPLLPQGGFSVTSEELAALELLKSTGLPILEAAQVACAAMRAADGSMDKALRAIQLGADVNHFSTEEFPPIVKAASHPHHLVQEVIVCTRLLKMGFRLISTPCFCFAGLSCR